MSKFRKFITRLRSTFLILILAVGQVVGAAGPFMQLQKAVAAPLCTVDTAGANDEPGQKDLTKLCVDYAGNPTTVATTWNWDDLGTSGANTLDACNLFDTDGDGNINYAVCVTTEDEPATLQTLTTYSCGDAKIDRCTTPATPVSSGTTVCDVSQQDTDPFSAGNEYPTDTEGTCTIQLSTVGGTTAKLIDVCSYPSAQPNSDPSDCVIARNDFGKVELIKDLIPGTDSGKFNLSINGPEASDTTTVSNVGDGGTTGEVVVKKGNVVVSETAGTNTALSGYDTSIVCKDLNGTGSALTLSAVTLTGTTRQATFTLVEDADVVCTITNNRQQATLILQKTVVNDNGGTLIQADFPVAIDGNASSWGSHQVNPGNFTVSETQQTGYSASVWGGDCDAQGNVTLASDETKTCTITNNDVPPSLTLNKILNNAYNGNATESDWTLTADGSTTDLSGPGAAGSADVVSGAGFYAGTYTLSESTGPSGYSPSSWTCTNNVTVTNSQITLTNGQTTVCSITNSETAPALTLIKNVTNNSGGTLEADDFVLRLNGTAQSSPVLSNTNLTATYTVAGVNSNTAYTLTEDANSTYAGSGVTCTDNTTQLTVSHPVTLSEGQSVTCTITNDDISPTIQLIKSVINDNGGTSFATAWTLIAQSGSDTPIIDEQGTSSDGGVTALTGTADAMAGLTYTLSEFGPDGYTPSTWSCDGGTLVGSDLTLSLGEAVLCTITNDDQQAYVIVNKTVVNDNGGTATANNFNLTVDSNAVQDEVAYPVNPGTHTAGETNLPGYEAGAWGGDCASDATVTVALGETKTCTITNDDIAPVLTLHKIVVSNNATHVASDWTLTATPTTGTAISGNGQDGVVSEPAVAHMTYTLSELNDSDGTFDASEWDCTSSAGVFSQPDGNNSLRMSEGANVTCEITNTERGSITIVKDAQPDSDQEFKFTGSLGDPSDEDGPNFTLVDDGQNDTTDRRTFTDLTSGTYTVTEPNVKGWDLDNVSCVGGSDTDTHNRNAVIKLNPGENVTCTFTNIGRATVIVTKYNDYNRNGTQDSNEPTLPDWDFTLAHNEECDFQSLLRDSILIGDGCDESDTSVTQTTGQDGTTTFNDVLPNKSYELTETLKDGWHLSNITCSGNENNLQGDTFFFSPSPGQTVNCFVGNYHDVALLIEKSNNRPNPTNVGDTVTYTLQVTVPENSGPSYNTTVTDLPPQGFTYEAGSWTANSSVRGDLKPEITPEPGYGSPGTWLLGNLLPGEIVTLTYRALIGSSVSPGTYPDVAFALGCETPTGDCEVLGNVSAGANTPFVATKVTIKSPQVLGATTTVLVNTGAVDIWRTIVAATLLMGLALGTLVRREKKGGRA